MWLRRAKAKAVQSAPPAQRASLRSRFRGVGFHSEKRSLVRDPRFRALPTKIQESYVGTKHETLRKVYDEVTPDDLKAAMQPRFTTEDSRNREQEPRAD